MHQLAATSDPKARGQLARKISGRIAYVRQFHPQSAAKMAAALARVTE
jgi:hypothetical protein